MARQLNHDQMQSRSISDCTFCPPSYSTKAQYECASCARQFCMSHFVHIGGRVLTPLSPITNDAVSKLTHTRKPIFDKIVCNECVPCSVLDGVIEPRYASYSQWSNFFSSKSEVQSVIETISAVSSPQTPSKPTLHTTNKEKPKVAMDKPKRRGRKEIRNKEPTPQISSAVKVTLKSIEKNQKELAAEIGTSTTTISSYLTGKVRSKGWTKLESRLQNWMKKQRSTSNNHSYENSEGTFSDLEESEFSSRVAREDYSSEGIDNSMESEGSSNSQQTNQGVDMEYGDAPVVTDYNFGVSVM